MTGDHNSKVPRCPIDRRPLHPLGDPKRPGWLRCLRSGHVYAPDDPTLDWGPPPKRSRPVVIGGPPIGGLLLGPERFDRVNEAARDTGVSRNEWIRRAIDHYLTNRS